MVTKTYEPFGEFTITDPEAIKTADQLTSELASQQQLYIDSITDWGGFISQVASWGTFKQLFSEMDQYRKSYIEANHNWSLCVHEQSANYQYLLLNPIATDERVVDDYKKLAAVCTEFDKINDQVVDNQHNKGNNGRSSTKGPGNVLTNTVIRTSLGDFIDPTSKTDFDFGIPSQCGTRNSRPRKIEQWQNVHPGFISPLKGSSLDANLTVSR